MAPTPGVQEITLPLKLYHGRLDFCSLRCTGLGFSTEKGELVVCAPLLGRRLLCRQITTKQRPLEVLHALKPCMEFYHQFSFKIWKKLAF